MATTGGYWRVRTGSRGAEDVPWTSRASLQGLESSNAYAEDDSGVSTVFTDIDEAPSGSDSDGGTNDQQALNSASRPISRPPSARTTETRIAVTPANPARRRDVRISEHVSKEEKMLGDVALYLARIARGEEGLEI